MKIEIKDLKKDYEISLHGNGLFGFAKSVIKPEKKMVHAVRGISFSIESEIVGYIGPNGAGKSTTIKMLTGILQPTSGNVSVCGIDPAKNRIQNAMNIGAVFGQKTQLFWDLPVRETFGLLKRMYQIDDHVYRRNLEDYISFLEMGSFMEQPVRLLSLGQRIRAEIAASLLHDPKVLFLDEPTIGLDINIKLKIREFIKKINEDRNVTILLTTHDLSDIESLAKRIIVINHGKLCFDGSIDNFKNTYKRGRHSISLTMEQEGLIELPEGWTSHIQSSQEGRHVQLFHDEEMDSGILLGELLSRYKISDIEIHGPQIEDIVLEAYNS